MKQFTKYVTQGQNVGYKTFSQTFFGFIHWQYGNILTTVVKSRIINQILFFFKST